jgi:hypothetical protein
MMCEKGNIGYSFMGVAADLTASRKPGMCKSFLGME